MKNPLKSVVILLFALTWLCSDLASAQTTDAESRFSVSKTYDSKPFEYKIIKTENQDDNYRVVHISYPSAVQTEIQDNNTIRARLFIPSDISTGEKRPAVISLPILNGDENLNAMVCAYLAKRGVISIMFTLPYYFERGNKEIRKELETNPRLFVQAIEQTFSDIRRTADLLQSRPEVDPQKIGITGISLGGILSASAAEMDDRFYKTAILLGGGDLMKIIDNARETRALSRALRNLPEQERSLLIKKFTEIDPLTNVSKLKERARKGNVLMINAGQDEVIPRECSEKLAQELGIKDRVIWYEGLGHYTALAELPGALNILANFFSSDLPGAVADKYKTASKKKPSAPIEVVSEITRELLSFFITEPEKGKCHFLKLELNATNNSQQITGSAQFVVGGDGQFSLTFKNIPSLGEGGFGYHSHHPWFYSPKALFVGSKPPLDHTNAFAYVDGRYLLRARAFGGAVMSILLVPNLANKWVKAEYENEQQKAIIVRSAENSRVEGFIKVALSEDKTTPMYFDFDIAGVKGRLNVYGWRLNTFVPENCFAPPISNTKKEVSQVDLNKMIAAVFDFIGETLDEHPKPNTKPDQTLEVVDRAQNGHGVLCSLGDKRILIVDGTPEEMGAAHGALLKDSVKRLVNRVLFGVGAADTFRSGEWFIDVMEEIHKRTAPHIPKRFIDECYSLADSAKVPGRDALYANLFPERFHCSGIAVKGKATLNGQILHARVLDYMRDIGLQNYAAVVVFLPEGKNAWMTLGYAGFIGTVTAMNEKGVAIGEMGGRGEGLWDGLPMSLLLREVMERASTGEEAVNIIKNSPRTCEYYYVVSDKSGYIRALHCLPDKIEILKPGEQHPLLPTVPEDSVFVSGDERAKTLSKRLIENYGKIDAEKMIEIIKRPVAMKSNLHNAIFAPQTLDMWFADAGKTTPACDEPYYKVNLSELIKFYRQLKTAAKN